MARPTLAEVLERHAPAYLAAHAARMPQRHVQAIERLRSCGTVAAGRVFYQCPQCADWLMAPASCGHRACNACGHHKTLQWTAKQEARLLPVDYLMLTFTLPAEFRALFRRHQTECYNALFKQSAATLQDIAADPRHLGAQPGMSGVLHTWTRDLRYHPHIHYIVPAGGLRGDQWIHAKTSRAGKTLLLPVKVLATRMRNRMMKTLRQTLTRRQWQSLPPGAWKKRWNVHEQAVGRGQTALGYLARYVQKTALAASRLIACDAHSVTFSYTERKTGQNKTQRLSGHDFLQRYLQHILPTGLTRVRHFGWLSAAAKKRYGQAQHALASQPHGAVSSPEPAPRQNDITATTDDTPTLHRHCCKRCAVEMRMIEYWPAGKRGLGPEGYALSQLQLHLKSRAPPPPKTSPT